MSSNGQNNLPEALLNMNNQLQMIMQLGSLLNQGALGGLNLGGSPQLGSPPQIPQQTLQQQQLQQPLAPPQNTPNLFSILGLPQNATASAGSANGITNGMGGMVGSCENDEELLVSALRESGAKGWTYRQALESLHGVHHHTANQWKDYYLDHAQRINSYLPQRDSERPVVVAKKPTIDSISRNGNSSHHSMHPHSPPKSRARESPVTVKQERLSAAERGRLETKVKVKAERTEKAKGKERASCTPSPPRNPIKRGQNKYLFSDEDRDWFVRYANYRLKEDPNLKKLDICAELARKAPHHSATSWMSHWWQQRDYYDARIPHFQEHAVKEEPPTDDTASSSENDDDSASGYSSSASESSEETDSEEDIKNMSGAGEAMNDADRRVIARYIASLGIEWESMTYRDRWEPIQLLYPQRNWRAWAQIVANHSKAINTIARKYRRRSSARKSVLSQRAIPSWAKKQTPSTSLKRARSHDEEDDQSSKRTRDDEPSA